MRRDECLTNAGTPARHALGICDPIDWGVETMPLSSRTRPEAISAHANKRAAPTTRLHQPEVALFAVGENRLERNQRSSGEQITRGP
jgi:hypothetical protein